MYEERLHRENLQPRWVYYLSYLDSRFSIAYWDVSKSYSFTYPDFEISGTLFRIGTFTITSIPTPTLSFADNTLTITDESGLAKRYQIDFYTVNVANMSVFYKDVSNVRPQAPNDATIDLSSMLPEGKYKAVVTAHTSTSSDGLSSLQCSITFTIL